MEKEYDVIIIGAGFGGPVAAKKCADAGLKTLIVERAKIPGEKVYSGLVIPVDGFLFGPKFIRNGNPPIERPIRAVVNRFIRNGEVYATDSVRIPGPMAAGYSAYCKPFCTWLADRAVESGAELRTSTVAVDTITENGRVKGIITDSGERIRSKIVIDAGGTQNTLSIKAGIRKKLVPEALELYMTWDFEMAKGDVDRIFGHSMEFFHAMPEEKIGAPLGYGSTFYFFTYRNSIHPGLGQFLETKGEIADVAKLLDQYFDNFTSKVTRWKEDIAPYVKLRAKLWDVCPIYAGLIRKMREMPIYGDGILFIGDAAGLESTAFGDGVPQAWFSADIAADVAIKAIKANNTSRAFLRRYEDRINAHPRISASLSDPHRWELRRAAEHNDEAEMRRRIHDHWGRGILKYWWRPILRMGFRSIAKNPTVMVGWLRMFLRYERNWQLNRFDKLSTDL